jgi:hypothetical protein
VFGEGLQARGLEIAFRTFGGVPREVLLDNARTLVLHHDPVSREAGKGASGHGVPLDVADPALVLALGAGTVRRAGPDQAHLDAWTVACRTTSHRSEPRIADR